MTQSISNGEVGAEDRLTEISLLGMVGYVLFMTAQLSSLYSPVLTTAQTDTGVAFCLCRCVAMAAAAAFHFVFSRFVKNRDRTVRSAQAKVAGLAGQALLPVIVVIETATGLAVPAAVVAVAWACWGCANALLACSWVDAKSNLEESYATKIAFWSFAITSFLLVGMLALTPTAALGALLVMEAASCLVLLQAPPHRGADMDEHDEEWLSAKSSFRRSGSYVMIVDGVLISFCAGVMMVGVLRDQFPLLLMGISFIGTAAIFCSFKRTNPALLSLERSQLVFLPVLAGGLCIMGFAKAPVVGVVAFVLFIVAYLFDFVNRSILSLRGNLLSVSPSYCFSKGRLFIIAGQAFGWVVVAFLSSPGGTGAAPIVATTLIVLVCAYITVGTILPEKYPLIDEIADEGAEETPPPDDSEDPVVEHPYKNRCLRAAQRYDLTPREGEILSYLARGRNAKYIADQLFVAERTVKTHTYHIYQKMDIHSQQELINIVEETE